MIWERWVGSPVARESDGVIYTTETSLEHGNSGGPVFYTDADGNLRVVGIVSAVAGSSLGFIVPLSAVR